MSTLLAPQPEVVEFSEVLRPVKKAKKRRLWAWILGLWLRSGVFLVSPDQQAVVTRLGAVVDPRVLPGMHYALPWPVDTVYKLKVRQLRRTVIGGDIADSIGIRLQPKLTTKTPVGPTLPDARAADS